MYLALWMADAGLQTQMIRQLTLGRLVTVILLLLGVWLAIRWISRFIDVLSHRGTRARFVLKSVEPLMRITLWFGAVFLSVGILAPTQDTFLALVGSVALTIALGAQDLVKNLIGGLVIVADRPYQLGDRVKIGDAYGEIDHIGLRSTKLTTPDDTRVTIPNSEILSSMAYNSNSGVPDCQVVTDVFVPHDVDPRTLERIAYDAAYSSPYLHLPKPVMVLVSDMFDQRPYMRLRVKAYVYDHRYEPAFQSDITIRVKTELNRAGLLERRAHGPA